MVSRILISIALLCSSVAMSQDENGMTFSQVLLVEETNQGIVVPEGKIWKIVAITRNDNDYNSTCSFDVNGITARMAQNQYSPLPHSLPLWLPQSTLINNYYNLDRINVIEFNIN